MEHRNDVKHTITNLFFVVFNRFCLIIHSKYESSRWLLYSFSLLDFEFSAQPLMQCHAVVGCFPVVYRGFLFFESFPPFLHPHRHDRTRLVKKKNPSTISLSHMLPFHVSADEGKEISRRSPFRILRCNLLVPSFISTPLH